MTTVHGRLLDDGLMSRVLVSEKVAALLEIMEILDSVAGNPESGHIKFQVTTKALGVFDLNLTPPDGPRPFVLRYEEQGGVRSGFRVAVALSETPPAKKLFDLIETIPGYGLRAAQRRTSADEEWLEPAADPKVTLSGIEAALVVKGRAGEEAVVMLSPSMDGPDGLIVLSLNPSTVLLGGTGFGLEVAGGIAFDDTADASPPGKTVIDGTEIATPADAPAWRGIAVRNARFYLPKGVPFLGGHAVDAHLEIGKAPAPGLDLLVETKVPPHDGRPGISVRIECRDPSATGLSAFVPTLVEAAMELPLDGRHEGFGAGSAARSVTFAAGKPVIVRARFAREPQATNMLLSIALESQGPDGILSVSTETGGAGAKAVVAAGALITALVADQNIGDPGPGGDQTGVWLHILLTAAAGLSSFLDDRGGKVVLHGAELITEGKALVGGKVRLKLDYSVNAVVTTFDVGVLSIGMRPHQPMKVRVREVVLTIDPSKSGLEMIHLGIDHASLEIEDPGGWNVKSPGSLFDILGTRSGRGSLWLEVDLRFKLDLGPVKVSGATIRATIEEGGGVSASLRGLAVRLDLSPTIKGDGAFQLLPPPAPGRPPGFSALLSVGILPLGVGADATLLVQGELLKLSLGVDLPGPIPLFNTGLGLFGLGGMFVMNGRPAPAPAGEDAVTYQLRWDYRDPASFLPAAGSFTFGLEAVLGTAPDLGFSLSARAGLFLTTPEIAVRGALAGKVLAPRVRITDRDAAAVGLSAKGVVVVDVSDGVTIGIEGLFIVPKLVEVRIPIGARFPVTSPADWYVYLGADGPPAKQGREMGPVRALILPGIFDQEADAYLMFRGNGIEKWPRGGPLTVPDGFVLAFGFGFQFVMGLKPVLWAEVHARADVLITTHPLLLAGFGNLGGSLHLGPVSIGVDANVEVLLADKQAPYLYAKLCGHVDLFFFEVSGCVHIEYGNKRQLDVPAPTEHPLDRIEGPNRVDAALLIDDRYRVLARLARDAAGAPQVWPDAIPHFSFSAAPVLTFGGGQFPGVQKYPEGLRAVPFGSDLLSYEWKLTSLELRDVTDGEPGVLVNGPLSASWLAGKSGDAGGQPEPAELVLLTPQGDLWVDRLTAAGAGLPNDPVQNQANICRGEVKPLVGWALGGSANPFAASIALPPDPVSADPLQSRVAAVAHPECTALPASLDVCTAQLLPPPLTFTPPRRVLLAPAASLERLFDSYLELGLIALPPEFPHRFEIWHTMAIDFDDTLVGGRLWVVVERALWQDLRGRLRVEDENGNAWEESDGQTLSEADLAVRFKPSAAGEVRGLRLSWPLGMRMGVLGAGGVTAAARNAAQLRNKARAEQAQQLADAAHKGPPKPGDAASAALRGVLQPGRLYRIDLDLRWRGTLFERKNGSKTPVKSTPDMAEYDPTGAGVTELNRRSYYFRTTPAPAAGAAAAGAPPFGAAEHLRWLLRKTDLFHPEMLQRHLAGYQPGQSELDRFRNDPLRAHFGVSHAAILADQYGFTLKLGLRRTDVPGDEGQPLILDPLWTALTEKAFESGADIRRIEVYSASACELPRPGATLEAPAALAPRAWYEVYVLAKAKRPDVADGRLPGVSFRTSRWATPTEMMAGLGFPTTGEGKRSGDLPTHPAAFAPPVVEGEDAAFDAALDALGLEGWPPCTEPRVSVLWQPDGAPQPSWLCAGLLLESPEPIHRPGRLEVKGLRLVMGPAGAAVSFGIRRRDRLGTRLLFLTATPFRPIRWARPPLLVRRQPTLALDVSDRSPVPPAGADLAGALSLPLLPDFVEEGL